MATSAQYAATPRVGSATLTTGDTSLTTPSTVSTVLSAGASGTRIDYINITGVASTTASVVNLFIYDGINYILWQQVPVIAITSGTTTPTFAVYLSSNGNANFMPLLLPTGYSLRATVTVTQTGVRVTASGGDF
jgi:hypothetical protein